MNYSYKTFSQILGKLNVKFIGDYPACPMKNNHYCLSVKNDCDLGIKNNCEQRRKFTLNGNMYYITVFFYGENKNGFIKSTDLSIKNLITKEKELFKELVV